MCHSLYEKGHVELYLVLDLPFYQVQRLFTLGLCGAPPPKPATSQVFSLRSFPRGRRRGSSQFPKPTCFRGRGLVLEGGLRRAPNELYSSGFDFEADEEDNGCSEACREGEEKEKKKVKKERNG